MRGLQQRLLSIACAALLACYTLTAGAEDWQADFNGLLLNARFVDGPRDKPVFLIVHGTGGHHSMEIIRHLQTLLQESEFASLAITQSLGITDRKGFFDCRNNPLRHGQADPLAEISYWYQQLREKGWSKIILAGHSRGASQIALLRNTAPEADTSALVLLAPMTWQAEQVAADYEAFYGEPLAQALAQAQQAQAQNKALLGPVGFLTCGKIMVTPAAFRSFYEAEPEKHTPALIADVDLPTLVYIGSEDELTTGVAAQIDNLHNSNITLTTIDGADHFLRDLHLEDVVEHLLEHLP